MFVSDNGYTLFDIPERPVPPHWVAHRVSDPGVRVEGWVIYTPRSITKWMFHLPPIRVYPTREEPDRQYRLYNGYRERPIGAVVPFPLGGWVYMHTGYPYPAPSCEAAALERLEQFRKAWEDVDGNP